MEKQEIIHDLEGFAAEIRLETLKISASLGFDLVGGALSIADAVAVLYGDVMRTDPKNKTRKDRDWFVFAKSHCAPVLYAALNIKGYIDHLDRYAERIYIDGKLTSRIVPCGPDYIISKDYDKNIPFVSFSMNADRNVKNGVEFTNGSPGHGLSQAVGAAMGNRIQGRNSRVYVAIDEREADSGQVWEAAQFAAHHKLDHLICLVDSNKIQRGGSVDDVLSHGKGIGAKFDAFGWNVIDVADGNNIEQIYDALMAAKKVKGQPICVVLNTVAGKGVPFAESSGMYSKPVTAKQWDEMIEAYKASIEAVREQ